MSETDDLLEELFGPTGAGTPTAEVDHESWVIEEGAEVIAKMAAPDASVTPTEHAIYCLWVIDYAVRNSGTLEPMRELHPAAAVELEAFARACNLTRTAFWIASSADEHTFCEAYIDTFPAACTELRGHADHTT